MGGLQRGQQYLTVLGFVCGSARGDVGAADYNRRASVRGVVRLY